MLVVEASDFLRHFQVRHVALRQDIGADEHMGSHELDFRIGQASLFHQEAFRDPDLADVVQTRMWFQTESLPKGRSSSRGLLE